MARAPALDFKQRRNSPGRSDRPKLRRGLRSSRRLFSLKRRAYRNSLASVHAEIGQRAQAASFARGDDDEWQDRFVVAAVLVLAHCIFSPSLTRLLVPDRRHHHWRRPAREAAERGDRSSARPDPRFRSL